MFKKLGKMLCILFVAGGVAAYLQYSSDVRQSQPPKPKPEMTAEEKRVQEQTIKVNTARVTCRMIVKDIAKFKDSVEFQSIRTFKTPKQGVLVKLQWTGKNAMGMTVSNESSCNVQDNEVILFTLNGKALIEKAA